MTLSPTEQRKAREAEQRRKAIIKIVRKLIRKGGMGEISLRKVAELAGYSTTVVYTLFGDKAAASRYVQRIRAEFPDARDVTTGGNAGP